MKHGIKSSERLYNVLLAPVVSEKSTMIADKHNQVAFKVVRDATRQEVKAAVQALFKVLSSPWLLAQLSSLPGYNAATCGDRLT